MDSLTAWLNAAAKKKLSVEETRELFIKLNSQEKQSKEWTQTLNKICEGNLLLVASAVKSYAKRYNRYKITTHSPLFLDLLQVGYLGLRHAAERYDMDRARFSTCAVPWMKQRLGRYLIEKEQPIYIPEGTLHELYYFQKHKKQSNKKHAPKNFSYLISASAVHSVASLDKTIVSPGSWQGSSPLIDLIPSPSKEDSPEHPDFFVSILEDKMTEAQISPNAQDAMIAYARTGRIDSAAKKVGRSVDKTRKEIRATIKTLQELAT